MKYPFLRFKEWDFGNEIVLTHGPENQHTVKPGPNCKIFPDRIV